MKKKRKETTDYEIVQLPFDLTDTSSPPSAAIDTAAVALNLAGAASCFTETVAVGFVPDEFVAVTVVLLSSRPVCGSALISTVPFPEPDAGETLHQLAFAILLNNFMGQGRLIKVSVREGDGPSDIVGAARVHVEHTGKGQVPSACQRTRHCPAAYLQRH